MSVGVAQALVTFATAYLVVGLLFGIAFVSLGAARIDPTARHGTWGFRCVILPASALLWPLLAWRWWRATPPPEPRDAHRDAARQAPGGAR